jgi:hypothetical protein
MISPQAREVRFDWTSLAAKILMRNGSTEGKKRLLPINTLAQGIHSRQLGLAPPIQWAVHRLEVHP